MDQVHAQHTFPLYGGLRRDSPVWFDQGGGDPATVNEKNKEFMIDTTEDEFVAQYCFTALQTRRPFQGDASASHGFRFPRRWRSR